MSKQTIRKFRKNDYYEDEEREQRSDFIEKKNQKRLERALKTKDISILGEDEDDFEDYNPLEESDY